jgi:hypothetical protein
MSLGRERRSGHRRVDSRDRENKRGRVECGSVEGRPVSHTNFATFHSNTPPSPLPPPPHPSQSPLSPSSTGPPQNPHPQNYWPRPFPINPLLFRDRLPRIHNGIARHTWQSGPTPPPVLLCTRVSAPETGHLLQKQHTHGTGNINDSPMVGNRIGSFVKVAMQPCQFQRDGNLVGISTK